MRWETERAAVARDHPQPLLGLPLGDRYRRVPDGDGFVDVRGNGYLVGQWGRGRRLTVEVTGTTVTVRSNGHHAGGFHTVSYVRVWVDGVFRFTTALSSTGRVPRSRLSGVVVAPCPEVPP